MNPDHLFCLSGTRFLGGVGGAGNTPKNRTETIRHHHPPLKGVGVADTGEGGSERVPDFYG